MISDATSIAITDIVHRRRREVPVALMLRSVMDRGIVVPITVRVNYGGTYKLIDGLKRIVCQEALGFKTIPALIIGTERENG